MANLHLAVEQVRDLVLANRAIRAPGYRADRTGIAWGADVLPALMTLARVEKNPRDDRPKGWVGFARLPDGYEPEHAKTWDGSAFRLEFDLTADPGADDAVLVLNALTTLPEADTFDDEHLGSVDLGDAAPTIDAWRALAQRYQSIRRSDDDHDPPAVAAYIAALPGFQGDLAARIDQIIEREVPHVRRAVKWHAPFYGVEGQGWFASFSSLSKALRLTFTRGTSLDPRPPGGTREDARWLDLDGADAIDEEQIASWVRQASALPGWGA